jgi:hypothetical protein
MANEENLDADKAAWTIKAVPVDVRKKATACATRQDETMAQWLARAVETQARLDGQSEVLPPGQMGKPECGLPEIADGHPMGQTGLPAIREMAEIAAIMAQASGGTVPKTIGRHLFALLDQECRRARGLSPRAVRSGRAENLRLIQIEADEEEPSHAA